MHDIFTNSVYFGFVLILITYFAGVKIRQRFPSDFLNPILVASVLIIIILTAGKIPYEQFNQGAQYLNYLLTPTTVCLALPLYRQYEKLKKYWFSILLGLTAGCISSLVSVVALCKLFHMNVTLSRSLLPKSITSAIALGVSEEIGGIAPVTVAAVIVTGAIGAMIAKKVFSFCHIKHPIAQGLALGASSHAIGTTKAMEMGEVQGAMSSLAIIVTGILTVIAAPIVSGILG